LSVTSIGSNANQSIGSLLLQQLTAAGASAQSLASQADGLDGDLLTLSPAAQKLAKAPEAVTKALTDLLTDQKDVQGDLAQVKSYFQSHPEGLASLLSSLQGSSATSTTSNSVQNRNLLLTALMNGQSQSSDPSSLLSLLGGTAQATLFDSLGGSGSGSGSASLLG
jgi:hypothetical protein